MMAETDLFKGDAAKEETAGAFPSACKTLQVTIRLHDVRTRPAASGCMLNAACDAFCGPAQMRGIIDEICGPIEVEEMRRLAAMPTLASGKPRGSILDSMDLLAPSAPLIVDPSGQNPVALDFSNRAASRKSLSLLRSVSLLGMGKVPVGSGLLSVAAVSRSIKE
jgi:hypothetical protein